MGGLGVGTGAGAGGGGGPGLGALGGGTGAVGGDAGGGGLVGVAASVAPEADNAAAARAAAMKRTKVMSLFPVERAEAPWVCGVGGIGRGWVSVTAEPLAAPAWR